MAHILTSVSGGFKDGVSIKRALLSVSDKTGLVELASALVSRGVELLSTGGTAKVIKDAGLPVIDVSDYTGSPEILDGRVKTLHPKVHGGLLAVRGNVKHDEESEANDIKPIDLVVINLYPFQQTLDSGADFSTCVENIDIGGPSMLRSSAKNHAYVTILTSPKQYDTFLNEFNSNNGCTKLQLRKILASEAFSLSASYDAAISTYFANQLDSPISSSLVNKSYEPKVIILYYTVSTRFNCYCIYCSLF